MPSALLPRLPWYCQVSTVLAVTLLLSAQLLNRSALRPVARFPWPPWMVVTPSTTTASADFCFFKKSRSPRIRYVCFPLTLAAFTYGCFDPFGLYCLLPAHPAPYASLRSFCPSSPGFAFQLPSHDCSHNPSCLRLAVRRVNVRRRLSLPSYRPCRAYKIKPRWLHLDFALY